MRTINKCFKPEEETEKFLITENLSEPEMDFNRENDDELIDNLNLEQSRRLREAIRQADAGETVPFEEVMKIFRRWLPE